VQFSKLIPQEDGLKRKIAAVAVAAAALTAAACSSSSSSTPAGSSGSQGLLSTSGAGKTITVWIMTDAQKGWAQVVANANKEFTAATGAKVNVVYQNWTGYIAKYTSALAGSTGVPDVIEIGDTDTTTFAATGALTDLTSAKAQFDNSSTWLSGLEQSSTYNGKLYAVPYYAGDRIVIYRKDLWTAAGITGAPTTFADLTADLDKLNAKYGSNPNFSAMLTPGEDWYTAMSFVYGAGGSIATQSGGKWSGNLESAQSQTGLQKWATLATKYSKGVTTVNEANQDQLASVGNNVASIYGAGWEAGSITSATGSQVTADKLGYFQMPESAAFAGGSDLAVPAKAANAGLGAEWIKFYTNNEQMTTLAKAGAIPNTTSLLATFESGGDADAAMGPAVQNGSWVTPASTNWANVEAQHVLENMLQSIATGKATTAAAAATADQQINQILNAS
jgi:N,N'-diacetylchitobiose transport system substrate-binding protein